MRNLILFLILFLIPINAYAAETRLESWPGGNVNWMYLMTADGHQVPAIVAYTTDGNGNIIPISGGGGGGGGNVSIVSPLGSMPSASSVSVVIASDQGNIPVTVGNFPSSTVVTQGTSPWVIGGSVSVSNFPSTQPISGTVTANQGTNPWDVGGTVSAVQSGTWTVNAVESGPWTVTANAGSNLNTSALALDTSVNGILLTQGSSTSAQSGPLAQAAVSNSSPTYTNGLTEPLSLTTSGAIRVDGSAATQPISGSVSVSNFPATQPISGTVAVTQSTSPWVISGAVQQGTPPWSVSQSGSWTTGRTWNLSSGTDSVNIGNFPATQPISGTVTANQGTSPWVVSGTITANAGTGTFQTNVTNASIPVTQSGLWSVTANAGTNLNTSALALDTSVNGLLLAQGSTTSGEKGPLVLGAVTTSSPSYATAQTSPFSLTTAGALRVDGSSSTQPVSGSISVSNFPATQPVSGTVTSNQGTSPWVVSGTITASQGTSPWVTSVSNFPSTQAVTQSTSPWVVSGTITANQGGTWTVQQGGAPWSVSQSGAWSVTANAGTNLNTSALALDTSVNGILRAQASTSTGQSGPLVQGAVTSSAPTYSNGTTDPLSITTAGALRVDGSAATQPVSGSVTVTQSNASQLNALVQQGTVPWTVNGYTASGATNLGNPVKIGGAFNTTQPTVTNGQTVDLQSTARGAMIVSTGVDPFNVTQSGSWTTGRTWTLASGTDSVSVVQSTSPWVANISQFGGSNVVTGTGNSGSGIPRVTISNDSSITNISGTISLPTGASTSANQATEITSLGTIATNTGSLVTLQTAGNASLASIDAGVPAALGQTTMANSMPVTIASNQSALAISSASGSSGTPTESSVSCATATTTLLAASAATKFVVIRNPTTATATVWVNVTGVSAVAAAPSIDIPPGGEVDFAASENSFLPTTAYNCISGGAAASSLVLLYK